VSSPTKVPSSKNAPSIETVTSVYLASSKLNLCKSSLLSGLAPCLIFSASSLLIDSRNGPLPSGEIRENKIDELGLILPDLASYSAGRYSPSINALGEEKALR